MNGGIYIQATVVLLLEIIHFPTPPVKPVIMAFTKSYDRPYEELEQGVYAITTEDIRWLRCDIKV